MSKVATHSKIKKEEARKHKHVPNGIRCVPLGCGINPYGKHGRNVFYR